MTKDETIKILGFLKLTYPNSFKDLQSKDKEMLIELWQMQFKEFEFQEVYDAVNTIISNDTSAFIPPIAKIKQTINKFVNANQPSESDIIAMITLATQNSDYMHDARKEFEKLHPIAKKIVVSPSRLCEWSNVDKATFNTVIASNLSRVYRSTVENEAFYDSIPLDIKQRLQLEEKQKIELDFKEQTQID